MTLGVERGVDVVSETPNCQRLCCDGAAQGDVPDGASRQVFRAHRRPLRFSGMVWPLSMFHLRHTAA